jgi:hypothetical protein
LLRFLAERFQATYEDMPKDDSPITPENKSKPEARSTNPKSSNAASRRSE